MNNVWCRSMSVVIAIVLTLGNSFSAGAAPASTVTIQTPRMTSVNPSSNMTPSRTTTYYMADRVINNADFAKLAGWGVNTAVVDFDVNGSASAWRAVFTSAAAVKINIVIWPSDWNDPRPNCGWEAPYPVNATGDITKVKNLLDVASQYPNFIGIVNAHESFWTCDTSFDEMAGLKDKLKAYALSKGRSIKVWNYIDNLYDKSMLPDNQIERIMDVAVTWQHCAGNVEGTCNTSSPSSALNMILNDRKRITDSGAQVELVFLMQTFTTGGYTTKFTLNQLQDYSCQFLNTSALDGFAFYTWHAGWWSDLHSWPDLQPAVAYIYTNCTKGSGNQISALISGDVGTAGVTLSYTDGALKTATSQPDGSYSLSVSSHWSGTVTPTHPCYSFSPGSRNYSNVTANQANQNYSPTFNNAPICAVTTGVFRPSNGLLYLKNSNTTGFADVALNYGLGGDYPVVGDWDGNGTVTIGVYRNGYFYLRNSNTIGFAENIFPFGTPGDQPIAGDWDGNGVDTVGVYRPSTGQFLLRNSNSAGPAEASFYLGNVGDVGIAGDWDGNGLDTTGVFRPSNGVIFLKNTNDTGFADVALNYGLPDDQPVTGDWDNDGTDTIGVYRNGSFYLRNENTNGFAEIIFGLGNPGDMPIAGNWDGLP